ncbi:MAG: insulinase family protein [Prevotellaceae bacterium]|jgi:predicted Zn-dependent peptidase|nr:insulinase family protein [Prevotellaceae bacterium]
MKKIFSLFIVVAAFAIIATAQQDPSKGFQQYKLQNGLTVYLWEDHDMPNVYGQVTVRAGSIDEPEDFTGLAHYLEHELFKGTQTIGALDWEKEKPIYEEIILLYDEFAATPTDTKENLAKREELTKKINEKSMEAAKYTKTDDFSNLIQGIGGESLNAYTSFDITNYQNYFPSYQMEKWLTIYADRLINPVFRSFQAELENVFEEYNMRTPDADYQRYMRIWLANLFEGTPYARDIIGTVEHLKNPSMTPMINFFNTWYVPNNMALALIGNFNSEEVKPIIEKTFGRLEYKELPKRIPSTPKPFKNQTIKAKMGDYPVVVWGYDGVKKGHPDELKLGFTLSLLNNSYETGLLDNLVLEGQVLQASAELMLMRDCGRIVIVGVPYYDANQQMFESDKATEKMIMGEVEKIKRGQIPSWLFQSVKEQYLQQVKLMQEYSSAKIGILTDLFAYQEDINDYFKMEQTIRNITIDDIKAIAAQYFSGNKITISTSEGEPKVDKIKKPKIKPLEPPVGQETEYTAYFKKMPTGTLVEKYNNFNDVKKQKLYDNVNLFYTENTKNDVFSAILEYGIGTHKMPKLQFATYLMNSAGAMPNSSAQDIRKELARYGASCSFSVDDNNFYIQVSGNEKDLSKIMQTIFRWAKLPKLDNRQIEAVLGSIVQSRMIEKNRNSVLSSALMQYIQYGKESPYINRIPSKELLKFSVVGEELKVNYLLSNTELTTTIQDATSFGVKIHYVGQKSIEEVAKVFSEFTPMNEIQKAKEQDFFRDRVKYEKPQIFFLANSKLPQADVNFYFPIGESWKNGEYVDYAAFDEYFSGGFSGLVMNEIREKRSLAYGASGAAQFNPHNKTSWFRGWVGSQNDKVVEVVETYMDLLTNMPLYPERIDNIKTILKASELSTKPSMRSKSMQFDMWEQGGWNDDPAKINMPRIDNLTFEEIVNFYNKNIKGKPIVIVIQGDPKLIDLKTIEKKYGKITKLSTSTLFKGGEF